MGTASHCGETKGSGRVENPHPERVHDSQQKCGLASFSIDKNVSVSWQPFHTKCGKDYDAIYKWQMAL
jgi:hypothetical protein